MAAENGSSNIAGEHNAPPMEGARVLILTGCFQGQEGVLLGKHGSGLWAISPNGSDEVLSLLFEQDFGLLVDLSGDPTRN
jgi:hypothetical protein